MLEARKDNKVYTIDERQKDIYLKQGFDIYKDGKIVEYTPLKTIKYSEHIKMVNELKEKLATAPKDTQVSNVFELLKTYASEKEIDIGQVTSATGALTKILESEKQHEE